MRPVLAAFLVCAAAAAVPAETPKEVLLNVVADDGHGRPVADLGRHEFQVFEDGKQQTISSFQRYEDDGPHPILILLDVLNTYLGPRGRAQGQIVAALRHLKSDETVYLYVLSSDGALQAVHAMPETGQAQREAPPWTRDARTLLDRALSNANTLRPAYMTYASKRAEAAYQALKKLASRLAEFSGRKAIVWVTFGVPTHPDSPSGCQIDYEPALQRFAAAFGQAEIAVYAIAQSAEGIIPGSMYGLSSLQTLTQFAGLTGGRLYPSDHIEEAVSQALADARLGYRLEYRAEPGKPDAEYRKVRVACLRPGVRIQSRQGYYPRRP